MSEISCRVFEFFERHASTYGYSLDELVDGLDTDLSVLQDPSQRVPWAVWAGLSERFEALIGGPAESIAAGEQIIGMGFAGPVRTIGGALLAPAYVYEAAVRWLGPYLFRNLSWAVHRHAPGHLSIEITVPEHDPPSPAWFRLAEGAFRTVPQAVAAGRATVLAQVDDRHARFEIRCASRTTIWSRFKVWTRTLFRPGELLAQLSELQADLRAALSQSLASQQELRRLLVSIPDPVAVVSNAQLLWANQAWSRSLGNRLPLELTEDASSNVIDIDQQRAFEPARPVSITWEGVDADLVLLRDVTQIREAAEHMRIADRLGALGMIAASVGHEINNPLAVALGSLELALADLDAGGRSIARDNLKRSMEAINQAAGVTSDLLTIARDSAEANPVDMAEVVGIAMRLARNELRHAQNLDVDVDIDDGLPLVTGSRQRLTQVVLNLLVNAVHAIAEMPDAQHRIRIHVHQTGDCIVIDVTDSGPGIPATLLADVKQPFFTTKGRLGSGLGLAVCERIVSECGGTIELTSLSEGGTRARVQLPVRTDAAAAPEPQFSPEMESLPSLRFLVVDDEPEIRRVVAGILAPHEVVTAGTYDAALAALTGDHAFDVILLDIMLMGRSGLELHSALPPDLQPRVVFMTGGVFLQETADLEKLGNPIVAKPFSHDDLLKAVLGLVERHGDLKDTA